VLQDPSHAQQSQLILFQYHSGQLSSLLHRYVQKPFSAFYKTTSIVKTTAIFLIEHSEIKVYLDTVVQDGLVYVSEKKEGKPNEKSLKKSLESLAKDIPDTSSGWTRFPDAWAFILSSIYTGFHPSTSSELFTSLYRTKKAVNGRFKEWLKKSYGSLCNHPPSSPVMVHYLPRYISQRIKEDRKVALLVIDGLSVSQ